MLVSTIVPTPTPTSVPSAGDTLVSNEIYRINNIKKFFQECKRNGMPEDMTNVRKVIAPALRKIRFLNFSAEQFTASMQKWKILTDVERSTILSNIADKTAFPLMPEGFSPSRVPRQLS